MLVQQFDLEVTPERQRRGAVQLDRPAAVLHIHQRDVLDVEERAHAHGFRPELQRAGKIPRHEGKLAHGAEFLCQRAGMWN